MGFSHLRRRNGLSLIELVLVMAIVGVLVGVSSLYIRETIDLWRFLSFRNEMINQGRMALSRMAREIRQVSNITSVYTATDSRFRFQDSNAEMIDYALSGTDLTRNGASLASGIRDLEFTYYGKDGLELTGAPLVSPQQTDIFRVGVSFNVTAGAGNAQQKATLHTQIVPRGFGS